MDQKVKHKIDSGYIVSDPADPHRHMAILYLAESDTVMVLRRAELSGAEAEAITPTEENDE